MKIHVGTSGYAYNEWKGKFYPQKISSADMLRFYSERFRTVEINYTFYHMPTKSVLESWAEQVPKDFVFAFKAPQVITHLKRLRNADAEADYLFRTLSVLGTKLGPVLFQFPGSFRADHATLRDFLKLLPGEIHCSFEFRNPTWLNESIMTLLRERGFSLCIADDDVNPAQEIISTSAWGYLRLRRSDYTDADLSQWVERVSSRNWKRAFVYFKHEEGAEGPNSAMQFRKLASSQAAHFKRRFSVR